MSLAAYKVIHVLSIMLLFTAFGSMLSGLQSGASRKLAGMTHGLALVLILVSGFGALAKIGLSNPGIWPGWLWLKVLIWIVFGGVIVLIRRAPRASTLLWWVLPLLGGLAGYLAMYKP
ncbi:MAG TPA: hypothetical protein VIC28_08955 [Thermoanaerobaculia bacterium]|jgi:hypothetical protein